MEIVLNKLTDYLYVFRNAFSGSFCDELVRDHRETSDWIEHSYVGADGKSMRNEKEILNTNLKEKYAPEISNKINELVNAYALRYYTKTKLPAPTPSKYSIPRINRYVTGSKMNPHHDNIVTLFDARVGSPALTILIGLNDENVDYTGGELFLFDNLKVTLNKGDVLIFPSAFMFPHRVDVVASGERWSIVSWAV